MSAKPINLHCAYCKAAMPSREIHIHLSRCAIEHDHRPAWDQEKAPAIRSMADLPKFIPAPEPSTATQTWTDRPQRKAAPELTGWAKLFSKLARLGDLGDAEMAEEIAARGIRTPPGWVSKPNAWRLRWLEENEPMNEE